MIIFVVVLDGTSVKGNHSRGNYAREMIIIMVVPAVCLVLQMTGTYHSLLVVVICMHGQLTLLVTYNCLEILNQIDQEGECLLAVMQYYALQIKS